ncbi:hypothetical protein C8J57DRAFT_1713663 [Mycena rebaudengoi]|nr:hypothetical protein C8J57DRAFT_1713663 [Mycena rebaudengoi]
MSLRLRGLRDELAELRISIAHQGHPVEELEHRRAVVEAELDFYTYPVLTLPPEITAEIFVQSLPSHAVRPHPSRSPLILLRICRTWRILALSTPALWTSLHLEVNGDHRALSAPGKLETFVETWFHRARTLPRSFGFVGFGFVGLVDNADNHTLNTIIDKQAPYLREISVYIDSGFLLNLRGETVFPLLHHLELSYAGWIRGPPRDAFLLAPRLQSLSLCYVTPAALTLPWEQLTTFSAQNLGVEECLSVLRMAPCLREFHYYGEYETQTTPAPPFSHPGLISLYLSGRRTRGIIPFLTLPNLERLHLERLQLGYLAVLPHHPIPLQFISSPSLHTFIFGHNTPVTLQWLRVMEHLTSLELGDRLWAYKEDLFHALDRAHEPRFLPKLEVLTLSYCETHEIIQRLLAALTSRCGPAAEGLATLKSFYISDGAGQHSQLLLSQSITTT